MKKEDNSILNRCGNRRPFTTPDGYFESLTGNIMASLPAIPFEEPAKVTLWNKAKVWVYMAASFVGLVFIFNFAVNMTDRNGAQVQMADSMSGTVYSDEYIDSFFETANIDEYTLYCSLTGNGGIY